MPNDRLARSAYLSWVVVFAACVGDAPDEDPGTAADAVPSPLAQPVALANPAAAGSMTPFLHADDRGVVRMSWLEPADTGHALRFAELNGTTWSEPRTIAQSTQWFVNWADFPSLLSLSDGTLAAHWLEREGPGTYAYGVRIAVSNDGGATWSPAVTPHRDGKLVEHGFVSMFPVSDGFGAVWLDGRNMAGSEGAGGHGMGADMTLRATTIEAGGALGEERLVDDRTCECCQTDVAVAAGRPVLVYRDRSPDEVRDIAISRYEDGGWTAPRTVHADGWNILACPVNGPAIAADGDRIAVAWFTAAQDTPRVRIAFSTDGGDTFGAPVRVDEGDPAGRVDVLLLDGGDALVSWLEHGEPATVRIRHIAADGRPGPSTIVAETSGERASGFPRMARTAAGVLFAWTVPGEPGQLRTALAATGETH